MRRALAILALFLSTGCASVQLTPGDTPSLDTGEGLLVIGVDVQSLVFARFVPKDPSLPTFAIDDFYKGVNLRVVRLPKGEYCLSHMTFELRAVDLTTDLCVAVGAEKATLFGFVERGQRVVDAVPPAELRKGFVAQFTELARELPQTPAKFDVPPFDSYTQHDL